jgi:mannose/cellobiose epimerase-like protein (N-acyl-D-glucosamine 2-epimerase family)
MSPKSFQAFCGGLAGKLDKITADNLRFLVKRNRDLPGDAFLDCKVKILTGEEFGPLLKKTGLDVYRDDMVFSWIQGRGLEALSVHLMGLDRIKTLLPAERSRLQTEIPEILSRVTARMEKLRETNGGRVWFAHLAGDGKPVVFTGGKAAPLNAIPPESNYSDIFYSKGLFAASAALEDASLRGKAAAYFRKTVKDILGKKFKTDQQPVNPGGKPFGAGGTVSFGPAMIALGGLALFTSLDRDPFWIEAGKEIIDSVIKNHVSLGQFAFLEEFDTVEFLDSKGAPARDESGAVICDPGHALEFAGLAAKFLLAAAGRDGQIKETPLFALCRDILPKLMERAFALGHNPQAGGICKSVNLLTGEPVNSGMPWWSLSETMRAAALLSGLFPEEAAAVPAADIFRSCASDLELYIRPDFHSLAVQTRDSRGRPADVMPAVPDADPCYHTGLSLLDALSVIAPPAGRNR